MVVTPIKSEAVKARAGAGINFKLLSFVECPPLLSYFGF
jgi:hypothetical protein